MSVTAEPAPWFTAIRALDLTRARTCIIALLLIGGPALAGLVTWDGPFQTPDEAANFARSVQLSEGRFLPRLGPAGDAAGDTLDVTVQQLGRFYTARFYDRYVEPFGEARADFAEAWATPLAGTAAFYEFSNTVIYFPLAHAIPAAVTAGLRAAGAPPLAWNYAARAVNAGVAIGLYCLAIMIMPDAALFILVFALLPRTLFATASLSPDSLLLPVSALFGALLGRLARAGQLSGGLYAGLAGCTIVIGVFKIAYVPLVVLPTLVELIAKRRLSAPAILLVASALLAVGIWAAWMAAIKPYVFTIRHDVPVDVYGQLRHLMREPLRSVTIVKHTIMLSGRDYLKEMVGGNLGSTLAKVPRSISVVAWVMLVAATFAGSARARLCRSEFALALAVSFSVVCAVLLLLYMQYTELDADYVDGVQGRYFLPLLPVLALLLPKFQLSPLAGTAFGAAVIVATLVSSAQLVSMMRTRYWMDTTPVAPSFREFIASPAPAG